MKVRKFIGAFVVAGVALAPAAALAQATGAAHSAAKVDDGTLKTRIETRLKHSAALKGDNIDVAVDHGVVTLTGTVHSEAQSLRARSLAKVNGVTNVENKLTVDSKTTRAMDRAGDKADRGMEKADAKAHKADVKAHKADDKADRAVTKGKNESANVGEEITDAWITTKVKAGFLNEDPLKGSDINVDTNNHVVTLKGTVTSAAGRARAVAIARATKGVTRVVDSLTIAPAK